jgi:hypothetical protein
LRKVFERKEKRTAAKLEEVSRAYGLASRVMALVAVHIRPADDASQTPVTRVVPVGMPEDTAFESYFWPRYAAKARFAQLPSAPAAPPPMAAAEYRHRLKDTQAMALCEYVPGEATPDVADLEVTAVGALALPSAPEPSQDTVGRPIARIRRPDTARWRLAGAR